MIFIRPVTMRSEEPWFAIRSIRGMAVQLECETPRVTEFRADGMFISALEILL